MKLDTPHTTVGQKNIEKSFLKLILKYFIYIFTFLLLMMVFGFISQVFGGYISNIDVGIRLLNSIIKYSIYLTVFLALAIVFALAAHKVVRLIDDKIKPRAVSAHQIDEIQLEFLQFISQPNRERYLQLFNVVTNSKHYAPYSSELNDAMEHYEKTNDAITALEMAKLAMPNQILNPNAHMMLSFLYDESGDKEAGEMAALTALLCLEGIISSGEGTEEMPYIVSRISDEYDVLQRFGKEPQMQSLVEKNGKQYDHITCTDGTELWFDITVPKSSLDGML